MLTEHGKTLHRTWEDLPKRPNEALPIWQDIKAVCIAAIMKHLWILEYQPPEALIVRFMGSEVVRLGGQDNTGKDFLKTRTAPENRAKMLRIYSACWTTPCGAQLTRILRTKGQDTQLLQTVFFPLAHEREGHWALLGLSEIVKIAPGGEDDGIADYASSELLPPEFIDIGYGIPKI
ncbi:PAS domain-containing protein [Kordiimonas sp.]|uniref:PAS domain-containing protein n=1 Tax=Kordiimonas sp. TaxID=1970157 RepID=UPI003A9431E5